MNRDLEENRIRNLFHELKLEDERAAPSFERTLESARMRKILGSKPRLVLRILTVTAALALIAVFAFALFRQPSSPQNMVIGEQPKRPVEIEKEETPPEIEPEPVKESVKVASRNLGRKRARDKDMRAARLISEWRSPTEFLLKTPGQELFDSVPRPDRSIVEIKGLFPNEKN